MCSPLGGRDPIGPVRQDLLNGRPSSAPGMYRVLNGRQPGGEPRIGVRRCAQPPQPQQMMKLAVVLWPPGTRHGSVILSQELIMELCGQDAHDLDRVIRVIFTCRLCRHLSIVHQWADITTETGPS